MDGNKIRKLRKEKGLTLAQFAKETGFTPSYISQIERNLIDPSLSALEKICNVLNVSIHYLLENSEDRILITRKQERKQLTIKSNGAILDFILPIGNSNKLKPNFGIYETKIKSKRWNSEEFAIHVPEECIIVKKGVLLAVFNDKTELLEEGDSLYIASDLPHKFYNPTDEDLEIMSITSPPIF